MKITIHLLKPNQSRSKEKEKERESDWQHYRFVDLPPPIFPLQNKIKSISVINYVSIDRLIKIKLKLITNDKVGDGDIDDNNSKQSNNNLFHYEGMNE